VQYLVGSWDFHRIHLLVLPPVLIPRPETEELVEWVLEEEEEEEGGREGGGEGARFLDVGCGTGAVGLALLTALRERGVDMFVCVCEEKARCRGRGREGRRECV